MTYEEARKDHIEAVKDFLSSIQMYDMKLTGFKDVHKDSLTDKERFCVNEVKHELDILRSQLYDLEEKLSEPTE